MIENLKYYISNSFDPYENLATEKYLFDSLDEGTLIVYLWQNRNTVVIGKNQNALAECRVELLKEEGGLLARRLSGGGAGFHDLGNLNFTFLAFDENFDLEKQMRVIKEACALAGIEAEISGRNDILADGRKFSGNAFYHSNGRSYHHGTLLINSDKEKIQKYLTPPKAKIEAKGVKSVKSRVVNLSELSAKLNCEDMKRNLISASQSVYGVTAEIFTDMNSEKISELAEQYKDWNYVYGISFPFDVSMTEQLGFGNLNLQFRIKNRKIEGVKVYTDALDISISDRLTSALEGLNFDYAEMSEAISHALSCDVAREINSMLKNGIFL